MFESKAPLLHIILLVMSARGENILTITRLQQNMSHEICLFAGLARHVKYAWHYKSVYRPIQFIRKRSFSAKILQKEFYGYLKFWNFIRVWL